MIEKKHEFQLSADEADYLNRLISNDESLAGLLKSEDEGHSRPVKLSLSRAEAEDVRDFLTTKLAEVGFGENYSPNEQGWMLEKLIDKFYLS